MSVYDQDNSADGRKRTWLTLATIVVVGVGLVAWGKAERTHASIPTPEASPPPPEVAAELDPRSHDPVFTLIDDARNRRYASREDVFAGRLLRNSDGVLEHLHDLDTETVHLVRRGARSVTAGGQYERQSQWHQPEEGEVGELTIRFVRTPAGWRMEHIRTRTQEDPRD